MEVAEVAIGMDLWPVGTVHTHRRLWSRTVNKLSKVLGVGVIYGFSKIRCGNCATNYTRIPPKHALAFAKALGL
jgi:hypothetical protein